MVGLLLFVAEVVLRARLDLLRLHGQAQRSLLAWSCIWRLVGIVVVEFNDHWGLHLLW